jgi:uncharacterized protein (TIGR03067 family)
MLRCATLAMLTLLPAIHAEQSAKPSTDDRKPTPAERDHKRLEGEWKVAFVEAAGQTAFPAGLPGTARIVFKDGTAEVKDVELLFLENFSFQLDPTRKPNEFDVTFSAGEMKGKTFAGIYVILENEVRICLRLEKTNLGRPKGFSTVSGAGLYTCFLRPVK